MEGDGDDHQEDLRPGVQLISVGDVLLLQPSKLVCQKGSGTLRVRIGAEVAVDEVDDGVGDVEEALQDVADAVEASHQGSPPILASLTDLLHLMGCCKKEF